MGVVIEIKFSRDLPTNAQNKLRYALELGRWRREWREAEAQEDWRAMDELNRTYEMVGLP